MFFYKFVISILDHFEK